MPHIQNIGPEMAPQSEGSANHSQAPLEGTDQKTDKVGQAILVQEDLSLCWNCKRRVGLLGFKCRCKFVFCSKHRYAEQHNCTFDYKGVNKEQLAKDLKKCEAEKVAKI